LLKEREEAVLFCQEKGGGCPVLSREGRRLSCVVKRREEAVLCCQEKEGG
jgi:hypothetical protein